MSAAKICLLTPAFPPWQWGGLAASAGRVAAYASQMGLEVHVVLARRQDSPAATRLDQMRRDHLQPGPCLHFLDLPGPQHDPAQRQPWDCAHGLALRALGQSLELLHRQHGFGLMHSFFLYPMGFVAGLTARKLGLPHLATVVGDDLNRFMYSPEKLAALQLALESARAVVFLSREMQQTASCLADLDGRGRVILNSVEMPPKAWRPRRGRGPWRLGCAGKFKWSKGLPYLAEALRRCPPTGPWELEVAGSLGAEEQAALQSLGGQARVLPPLAPQEVTAWLLSLDALALPSLSEGCPNLLMEAMACGLPCVATGVGAVPELMTDGVSGLMVPWADPEALGLALARLRSQPDLARGLGRQARQAMRALAPAGERQQWQELYRELLWP
ncbi:MAG: glycosyltransferase [Desulfarculus sp.]|nr:glycosyltransferase [Desulfarculus sp.]